ncbi:hypothetical protein RGUI_0623 [Rhodovulum sp. P5]|uniref:hypothetical protein n=1 Tax=Rhodovulum sp. P5 TaxID=1564506 RepID=UPI0009C35E44|nr:hypothetical protein [Rhodovulum sp. P5]ARE38764.1 hypothetical protein RGUI_0623 [Rhodovulum sp. P5]
MNRILAPFAPFLLLPTLTFAQTTNQCGPRDDVVEQLADRYGEARQALGLASNKTLVEVYANTRTGTWTITGTLPSGLTCLIASGDAFEALEETLGSGNRL